ncbi:TonB-dependent receptor [Undibacterium sp. SXout20W]|uniref:TonB-dependent receptor n=1 Tax=Undibacterium sp. SXout20W TaxID=3413051 RepID=UPI003BF09D0F
MKKFNHSKGGIMETRQFKLRPLAAVCALMFVAPVGVAMAQTVQSTSTEQAAKAAPDGVQSVVVNGLRGSIEGAITLKKGSDSIVEAISQEDIGKLPQQSIADALASLPGVAGQRVDGRAQVIAIRGMSPDFTGTLLNGREQASTGVNRGVQYDQYPAELISSVLVYKTPDATLLGGGLAGTVDLHTMKPLDYSERKFVVAGQLDKNSLGNINNSYGGTSDKGGRFSFSYVDQFDDHKLGVALGFAHLDAPGQQQHEKAWWWGAPGNGFYNGATALGGNEITTTSRKEIRDGLIGVVEYKPNASVHSTLDFYYSKFNQTEVMRGVMWDSNPWNGNYTYTNPGFAMSGGSSILNSGTIAFSPSGNQPVVMGQHNTRDDNLSSLGWNNEVKVGDWKLIGDFSYSNAKRHENLFESYAGTPSSSITFSIPTTPAFGVFTPAASFADPNTVALGDPGGWGHAGRLQDSTLNDTIKTLNLHARHRLGGIFSMADFGINFTARDKTQDFAVAFATLKNGGKTQLISPSNLLTPTSLAFAGAGNVLSYDLNNIANQYYTITPNMSGGPSGDYSHDFGVHERITTAYVKADIETEIGNIPVRGNIGAQFVNTNQYSNAWAFAANGTPSSPFENGTRYSNFLPSLNLVGDIGGDRLLRFGAARELMRPRLFDMTATSGAGVDLTTHTWGGGGGNPKLKPWIADAVDLSLEQYWGKKAYISATLFYKKLNSYIYQNSIPWDFTGYVNQNPTVVPVSNMGFYTTQANGTGGKVQGVELSASVTGEMLTPALSGFGVIASASFTDTNIKVNGPGSQTPMWATLPGLSKTVADLTFYYEKNGFSARISDRYRSSFRGEYNSLFGQTSVMQMLSQSIVDAQVSYELQEGRYKGMTFILQVANLTDTPDRNIQDGSGFGGATAPQEYNKYGRGVSVGMNYKFK